MAGLSGGYSKVRVQFPREIIDRKAVKEMLVRSLRLLMPYYNSYSCTYILIITW